MVMTRLMAEAVMIAFLAGMELIFSTAASGTI